MIANNYLQQIHNKSLLNFSKDIVCNNSIDILVPVYNGFDELVKCIASVIAFTDNNHNIYLYNDASTDERIEPWLNELGEKYKNIYIYHHKNNIGYLKNTNFAISKSIRDIIVLNSDTRVTENWLQELALIANEDKVGIVCPLSDNATILSLNNSCFDKIKNLSNLTGQWYALPTAVGSCMYIKRSIIEVFGLFDEYYNPGYGEECDYSLKIRQGGYQVACAVASFVFHSGSASFKNDAILLRQQHQHLLDLRWPSYRSEIQAFCESNPVHFIEEYLENQSKNNNILHIVHGLDSLAGVELFTKKLLEGLTEACQNHVLIYSINDISGQSHQSYYLNNNTKISKYQFHNIKHTTKIANLIVNLQHEQLDIMFFRYLLFGNYQVVHFHSLVHNGSLIWPLICDYLGVPYIVSCHDHFVVCSNFSLLKDINTRACGKTRCLETEKECVKCLDDITQYNQLDTSSFIKKRNSMWRQILRNAQAICVPHVYLQKVIQENQPQLSPDNFHIVEPIFQIKQITQKNHKQTKNKSLNVAFLGNFVREKGAEIFLQAYNELLSENISWHIIGFVHPIFNDYLSTTNIIQTGHYHPQKLPELLTNIDLVIFPTIRPESYCIALSETWLENIPVICSDIGVFSQRIINNKNGQLFTNRDSKQLSSLIKSHTDDDTLLLKMRNYIIKHQTETKNPCELIEALYKGCSKKVHFSKHNTFKSYLPTTIENAYTSMQRWLNADKTLEAHDDWREACNAVIIIIGNEEKLIKITKDSCQKYAQEIPVYLSKNKTNLIKSTSTIVFILAGNCLNDNFGNWLYAFKHSDYKISLADYALINSEHQFYAPQFKATFEELSFSKQPNRIGALLYNPNYDTETTMTRAQALNAAKKPPKSLTANQMDLVFVNSLYTSIDCTLYYDSISRFGNKTKHNHFAFDNICLKSIVEKCIQNTEIHYFPHLSYFYNDSLWVEHWKNDTEQSKPLCSQITYKISIVIFSNRSKSEIKTFIQDLQRNNKIKIEHFYIFTTNYISFSQDNISSHAIDFKYTHKFIIPVLDRCLSDSVLFINDNCQFTEKFELQQLLANMKAYHLNAISPVSQKSNHITATKLGNGYISGLGIIADNRFDTNNTPYLNDLLDEDCFIISQEAWRKCKDSFNYSSNYYLAHQLSIELYKNNYRIAVLPITGFKKNGIASSWNSNSNVSLNSEREQLLNSNSKLYLESNHLSKALNSNASCQLDYNFGTFKTPKNLPRIIAYAHDNWASGFYRIKAPLTALAVENKASVHFLPNFKHNNTASIFEINKMQGDILLLHNYFSDSQLNALEEYKKYLDITIVLSFDDLITEVPDYNPYSKINFPDIKSRLKRAINCAHRLIVTTNYLAKKLSIYHDDIKVVKNYLPKAMWQLPFAFKNNSRKQKLRIGWVGAEQHLDDLLWLEPIIKATQNNVQWVFYGFMPSKFNNHDVEFHSHTPLANYHGKLASLKLDIAIAPLIKNNFNRAKSNLKLIEYGALGIATICSNSENYRDSPAVKLENNIQTWIVAILDLIKYSGKREKLAKSMHQWVADNYFLEDHLDEWRDILPKSR